MEGKSCLSEQEILDLLSTAQEVQKKDASTALKMLEKVLTSNVPKACLKGIFLLFGDCYFKLKSYARSLDNYMRALDVVDDSEKGDVLTNTARCLYKLGKFTEAIQSCNVCINRSKDVDQRTSGRAYFFRGKCHAKLNLFVIAIKDYSVVLEHFPKNYSCLCNRGIAYTKIERDDLAMKDFNQAIQIKPKRPSAYMSRGVLFLKKEMCKEAIADFSMAIKNDRRNLKKRGWAWGNRGSAYRILSMRIDVPNEQKEIYRSLALENFDKAINIDGNNLKAIANRGVLLATMKKYESAELDFSRIIEVDPEFVLRNRISVFFCRAMCRRELKLFSAAIADYGKARKLSTERDPNHLAQIEFEMDSCIALLKDQIFKVPFSMEW